MHDSATELRGLIQQVRRRWRVKLAVRGALVVLAAGLLAFLASASALEAARFTAGAILAARIGLAVAIAALVALFFVRPLMRRVSDEQVALYLEEHEPSLQEAIISAVEATRSAEGPDASHSRALVRKLVENAVEKSQAIEQGRRVEQRPVRRYAGTIAAIGVAAIALFAFGPGYLRHAASALFVFSRDVEASVPYRIEVTPGNATVSKGADQVIAAQLSGFDADEAALMVRKGPDAQFERVPMVRGDKGGYDGMLFDLTAPVDYYVEAEGVRSGTYTLKVVELPYVQKLQLEYHFPAYTGLAPQKIEDGGDIAVLRGTEVRVRAVPTMATAGGQVVIEKGSAHPLVPAADGALTGSFKVDKDGLYHLEMDASTGERVNASPQYTIDVLADAPPTVSIAKPGRDTRVSPIEEVFVEARADDDFGVRNLELIYSVNGTEEKSIRLFNGQKRMAEVSAGHTFFLEELGLKAGDFVSYYARATDNDAVQGAKPATSDIYFMRVRPLSKDFKQAQSQASGGGGGQQGQQEDGARNLSAQQIKIISATFNVQRDRKTMTADKVRENTTVVGLAQTKLRGQVEELVMQMAQRLGGDPSFKKILELLPKAITEMKEAESKLQAAAPDAALQPEQRALQYLQQAEEEYETQVQIRQQQGGGGGGGGQQEDRDLSDLFELEVDRTANQYEMRQQASQQQADQKIDELAEKLKELARRQEQEAERQRRRAAAGQQQSGGGSGNSQRELAEQVEQAARQLEQLAREENRADLARSAQDLRQSADAMRRAAANGAQAGGAQSAEALERLRQAEQQLQRSQTGRAERDVQDAVRRAEEIAGEQKAVADEVRGLPAPAGRNREQVQQLLDRKGALEQKVTDLEKQIDGAAANMRRDERDASRRMSEAAGSLRDNRVRDKIRYSGALVRSGMSQADTENFEREIGSNLQALRDKLGEAQAALGRTKADPQAEALERARQLARNMESLGERARERTDGAAQNAQGAQGAQEGQRGQQGVRRVRKVRRVRQGQRGQQGQGAQGARAARPAGSARPGSARPGSAGPGPAGPGSSQGQQGQGQQGQGGQQGQSGQQGQQGQQGQGGQQGQQGGQGGQNQGGRTQDGRGGDGDTTGAPQFGGGGGSRRPGGPMSPEEARQFRAEVRQMATAGEQLRRTVGKEDQAAVADMLKKLRALDSDQVFKDPAQFDRLQAQAADAVKRFEFNLRRRAELKGNEVLLSGDGDVPEEFRKLVEQYYKSLSKGPEKPEKPEKK